MRTYLPFIALACVLSAPSAAAQCSARELAVIHASDPEDGDQFGLSVDVDGTTAGVGAWLEDGPGGADSGAAYVFERDAGGPGAWGQVAKLVASDGAANDAFGWSVAISGDIVVVGAYRHDGAGDNAGQAYVFERDWGGPAAWGERKRLVASNALSGDQFGYSVAIDGTLAVVGAWLQDDLGADAGSAYVYVQNLGGADNWGEARQILPNDGGDGHQFGRAVAVDASTVVVGAPGGDGAVAASGAAYVFVRNPGGVNNFGQIAKLQSTDGAAGDNFGWSTSVDGSLALVGAYEHAELGQGAGAAYLFDRFQGGINTWGQVAELAGSETSAGDAFGYAVGLEGNLALVGAYLDDGAGNARGAVYAFGQNYGGPGAWGQAHHLTASDTQNGDRYGIGLGLSGTTLVTGASHEDTGGSNAGASYVTSLASGPIVYCTAGTSASGCKAQISATGLPSATANFGFTLHVNNVEGDKQGLFFFSSNGRQAVSWGGGTSFQCVVPPCTAPARWAAAEPRGPATAPSSRT
jgi:hypothetical protein